MTKAHVPLYPSCERRARIGSGPNGSDAVTDRKGACHAARHVDNRTRFRTKALRPSTVRKRLWTAARKTAMDTGRSKKRIDELLIRSCRAFQRCRRLANRAGPSTIDHPGTSRDRRARSPPAHLGFFSKKLSAWPARRLAGIQYRPRDVETRL